MVEINGTPEDKNISKELTPEPSESAESALDELRKDYEVFKEKYELPEFSELNKLFDIEEIGDCETEFLLRKIRRSISEKIEGHLRFVETVLNPSNAPMFFFKMIKKLNNSDKEILTEICERLGKIEIEIVKLDLDYNEEGEANFIKNVFEKMIDIKKQLLVVVDKLGNGPGSNQNNSRSYFG